MVKPTYGLVSRCGIFPLSFSMDTAGPMAWTAEDCALMLDVLAGYDPDDVGSVPAPKVDYGAAAQRPIKGMRIDNTCDEYEYQIPLNDAMEMLQLSITPLVVKVRYVVMDQYQQMWAMILRR